MNIVDILTCVRLWILYELGKDIKERSKSLYDVFLMFGIDLLMYLIIYSAAVPLAITSNYYYANLLSLNYVVFIVNFVFFLIHVFLKFFNIIKSS